MFLLPLPFFLLALLILPFLGPTTALTGYQAVSVLKTFADSFLSPTNEQIARSINSTLFAEDVTGTADLSTNFDGRELSTEYLFGLFVNTAEDPTDPSPFGTPVSYNVTALLVQHAFISTSLKIEFHYPVLNATYPIQIDAFFLLNDQKQIVQYDVSFRRWAWATDELIPQLIPHMADRVNIPSSSANYTNATYVLQQYMAQKVCNTAQTYCNGTNQQYDSHGACMSFLEGIDVGQWYRMGEDNLVCRNLHVPMVSLRPSVHCPHIGPSGGDMCIPRDYETVVLASHFPQGWLAPKYVTPENEDSVGGIEAVSGSALSPLFEIALSATSTNSWDPTLYPTALLCYFLLFYVTANVLWFVYFRASEVFPTLGLEHQKNIVMYTLNIIITTVALALELVATPAFAGRYALWEIQSLRTGGVLISGLYIFELVYRVKMRIPLIIHHFLTIFAISFTVCVFEYTESMTYLISAVIWLFQATTEQPTFIGLLGYRLDWSPTLVAGILKFAAVQTFVLKSASAVGLMVYWGLHQNYAYRPIDKAWTAMVFVIAIGLLLTQIWGSYVTYAIGRRISRETNSNLLHTRSHSVSGVGGGKGGLGNDLAIYRGLRLRPNRGSMLISEANHPHQTLGSQGSSGIGVSPVVPSHPDAGEGGASPLDEKRAEEFDRPSTVAQGGYPQPHTRPRPRPRPQPQPQPQPHSSYPSPPPPAAAAGRSQSRSPTKQSRTTTTSSPELATKDKPGQTLRSPRSPTSTSVSSSGEHAGEEGEMVTAPSTPVDFAPNVMTSSDFTGPLSELEVGQPRHAEHKQADLEEETGGGSGMGGTGGTANSRDSEKTAVERPEHETTEFGMAV